ncbi:MAG: hypothetical protein JW783_08280 [Bacteroidales bacterium]|nr:hypothetical protein [Bacteroidales bacterium]MBN2749938.1 hypothetical protein [Bacteroidales bacterium]
MRTLTVTERTKLVKQLANLDYLESDILLFREKFPRSKLNNELLRINKYNATRLHGQLLYELLSTVSAEEIKKNRKASAPTAAAPEGETEEMNPQETASKDETAIDASKSKPSENIFRTLFKKEANEVTASQKKKEQEAKETSSQE